MLSWIILSSNSPFVIEASYSGKEKEGSNFIKKQLDILFMKLSAKGLDCNKCVGVISDNCPTNVVILCILVYNSG